jgi:16S rRNA (guanine1207-N2)-methyltransferase
VSSRLDLAFAASPGFPREGTILVVGPDGDADLSALPKGRLRIVQGFRPDHDALRLRGYDVGPCAEGRHAGAVVFAARSRLATRAAIADATARLDRGAPVWVDGQKTDGIEALVRDLSGRVAGMAVVSKAHGKCAVFASPGPEAFADWAARPETPAPGFASPPGTFSAARVDPGSELLAAALPATLSGRVADLGAGWAWLAAQVLRRPDVTEVHLVEADWASLEAARANVADPRARFHWDDARSFRSDLRFDAVVMNPPFHVTRAADPALGIAFIRSAAALLRPSGTLWLVANRQLPYESALHDAFAEVEELDGDARFKLFRAAHPRRAGTAYSPSGRKRARVPAATGPRRRSGRGMT